MRILILILILFPLFLIASDLSGIDAAYYDFDPRIIAMGGASVAVQGTSPAAIIANPAALAGQTEQYYFQVSNSTYLDLINYNYAGVSWRQQPGQVLSLAMDFSGDEALSEYEMILSYSRILSKFDLGINLKLLGSSYGNNTNGAWYDENGFNHQVQGSSYGFAIDWGLQYEINAQQRLGIFNRNLVNTIFYDSQNEVGTAEGKYNESRPVSLVLGYCYQIPKVQFALDYDLSLYSDRENYLRTGLEIALINNILKLRTGMATKLYSLDTQHYNLGCGIAFKIASKEFQLDIAYRIFTQWQGYNNLIFGLKMSI
ncbi:MAG: hypothetical protein RAO94_03740 [Candidatus Stygibacter australis]|nr:hypothetical protein [Candidatus Stygibacter australis]